MRMITLRLDSSHRSLGTMTFRLGVALLTSVFFLACSSDSPTTVDNPSQSAETSLVTAEAVESFSERFSENVQVPEVVQIPVSINIDELASLISPEFTLRRAVPADVVSYWRVSSVREKSKHWEVIIESVSGEGFFAGSQFFVRRDDGTFESVEAKEVNETPQLWSPNTGLCGSNPKSPQSHFSRPPPASPSPHRPSSPAASNPTPEPTPRCRFA